MNKNFSMKIYENRIIALAFIPMIIGIFIYKIYHPDPNHIGPLNDGNTFGILIFSFLYCIFNLFKKPNSIIVDENKISYISKNFTQEIDLKNEIYVLKIPIYMTILHNPKSFKISIKESDFKLILKIIIFLFAMPMFLVFYCVFHCLIYKTINLNYILICDKNLSSIFFPNTNQAIVKKYFGVNIKTIYTKSSLKETLPKGENNE